MRWLDGIELSGHEFEQAPGDSEGWEAYDAAVYGVAESDTTKSQNNNRALT